MKRKILYILGLPFIGMLSAWSVAGDNTTTAKSLNKEQHQNLVKEYGKGDDCIYARTIHNWRKLDKKSLLIYAPSRSKPYYVSLFTPSFELNFAETIGFSSRRDGRLCPYGGDALFIDGRRFPINGITRLNKEEAQSLIDYQKKLKAEKKKAAI